MTHIFAVWHWPAIGLRAGVIAASIALGEMLIVLVLRAHYTLDVVAGAGGVLRCGGGRKVVACAGCVVAMI
jgi:hypothetical protein